MSILVNGYIHPVLMIVCDKAIIFYHSLNIIPTSLNKIDEFTICRFENDLKYIKNIIGLKFKDKNFTVISANKSQCRLLFEKISSVVKEIQSY